MVEICDADVVQLIVLCAVCEEGADSHSDVISVTEHQAV